MLLDIKRKCPHCGKKLDGVIESNGNDVNKPRPGDYTVCLGCLGYLEFTETSFKKLDAASIQDDDARKELGIVVERLKKIKSMSVHLH